VARTPPRKARDRPAARTGGRARARVTADDDSVKRRPDPLPGIPAEVEKKLLTLMKQGFPQRRAAAACGIAPQTVRDWVRKGVEGDPRYKAFATAADEGVALHHLRVVQAGKEDWRASAFLLERIARNEYGYKADIGVTAYLEKVREALLRELEEFFGREAADRFADHLARKGSLGEEGEEEG
jgi:hypothetical protein